VLSGSALATHAGHRFVQEFEGEPLPLGLPAACGTPSRCSRLRHYE
jgi:hypothetical protein